MPTKKVTKAQKKLDRLHKKRRSLGVIAIIAGLIVAVLLVVLAAEYVFSLTR